MNIQAFSFASRLFCVLLLLARQMKISVCQAAARVGDIPHNFAIVKHHTQSAAATGSGLIVFPELFITGYEMSAEQARQLAETVDGPMVTSIRDLARSTGIAIVIGYPEKCDDGGVFNSAVFASKHGDVLTNYRKTHLWGPDEQRIFKRGDNAFPVVDVDGVKIGLLICYEIEFPEPSRCLQRQGADIIVLPTACASELEVMARVAANARAVENHVFVVYANMSDSEEAPFGYCGLTAIIGPDGSDVVRAGRTGAVLLSAECKWTQRYLEDKQRNPYDRDRRKELYSVLE
eukprot:TRINITY_DN4521_c0_g1_i1.p1 TRINITY_DN4521_c0_g1~~TRINITY_DN4521_c0_g1_i1.p1  ORF type:complete len:290 (-),score=71.13 TRINITY_DN4521_c0_g1_i1:777-1646(-)